LPARSNIWLALIVGVSCLLIGFAISTMAYRYHYLRVPGGGLIERLNRDLQLTPAQSDRISDIMRDTRFKVTQIHQDYVHQRHQLFWQGMSQIRSTLTPEQQKIFDNEFSRPWEHHGHGDHGGYGDEEEGAPSESAPPAASAQPSPAP
jgi:Spy/CpxP family protein refolding chaperone